MTNKQTIDGVSRELLEELQWHYKPYDDFYHKESGHYCPVCCNEKTQGHDAKCELRALLDKPTVNTDVRTILLEVVPGDGSGHEVYAKSVEDVEKFLSRQGELIEELESKLYDSVQPASQPQGEVERLKSELAEQLEIFGMQEEKIDALRAQLAERDALLRELDDAWNSHDGKPVFGKLMAKVEALSTSAEPKCQELGWITEDYLTDKSATTYDRTVMERWIAKGWPVYPLFILRSSSN